MRGIQIRHVRREDMQNFIKSYSKSYENIKEYAYTTRKDMKRYFKWLLHRDAEGFFVAELCNSAQSSASSASAIGFIACDANWLSPFECCVVGEIHELFVVPEMRGRGVGNALLQRGLAYFCEKNLHIAELWVGISNHAQKFYEKAGFKGAEIVGKWLRMWKCIKT